MEKLNINIEAHYQMGFFSEIIAKDSQH
jgi:hypothetical protein